MAKDPYADLFRFVAQAESGGRDYDAAGRVVTSPKGAKGSMQVMDATNLDPGYGVRPAADDSLEERARVGQDYLKAMIGNYGGDLTKGLAAYNAGPGNVDRALAAAQQAGDPNWMQYLPKPQETVPYVQKIVANMGSQPGTLDRIAAAVMPSAQASPVDKKLEADPLFQMLSGATPAAAATSEKLAADPVWQMLNAPATASESRGADGVLRLETSGTAPTEAQKQHTGVLGAIEDFGAGVRKLGQGAFQGLGDIPVGLIQKSIHQNAALMDPINAAIDSKYGTSLAANQASGVANADQLVAQREADYQASTPGSIAAGIGRIGGNIGLSMLGGPSMAAAPMIQGANIGKSLLPSAPGLGRFLGGAAGSSLQGAAYGAVSPVTAGDYDQQSLANTQAGAILGAVAPGVGQMLGAGGRYIGNNIRAAIAPFTEGGRSSIAQNLAAGSASGGPVAGRGSQIPGVIPTLAEETRNPGVANLQRTMRDLNPTPFIEREMANTAARNEFMQQIVGTPAELASARDAINAVAGEMYRQPKLSALKVDKEFQDLMSRPSMKAALQRAQSLADEQGAGPLFTTTTVRGPMGGAYSTSQQQHIGGNGLHHLKMAIDDMASGRTGQGIAANEKAALLGTKDKLLDWFEKRAPEYADARKTYAEMVKPITAMEYLQSKNLTNLQGDVLPGRVDALIKDIEKQLRTKGIQDAKSLSKEQLDGLYALREDMRQMAATEIGKTKGSATAQNLATQNMLAQALPGKLGALAGRAPAGSLGTLLGTGTGYMIGGPLGAAVGGGVGGSLGRTASSAVNMNNEAIQGLLTKMLLNEGGSGLAALQGASRSARPITDMGGLQRLLYPSVNVGGALGIGRSVPANNR